MPRAQPAVPLLTAILAAGSFSFYWAPTAPLLAPQLTSVPSGQGTRRECLGQLLGSQPLWLLKGPGPCGRVPSVLQPRGETAESRLFGGVLVLKQ
ncbi:hypothetical protein NDU88_002620 [Pleurodeles waltl]|uniref:Uncharacterized protein n=1 Tax=Pleurodeles waltl TaxID=8319 RepID=A0AAV7WS80_PLEWA|nr:hypothetical protein NDU88_002620 [Pleurodeles waltl]